MIVNEHCNRAKGKQSNILARIPVRVFEMFKFLFENGSIWRTTLSKYMSQI